ncbi:MAG: hypothetical protein JXB48_23405 [Candidatus Latescibacteria bacterium]|nr:hypothetical protein [Candidatus Latescibacterota bacterium]
MIPGIFPKIIFLIMILCLTIIADNAEAIDFKYGAALRQNVLLFNRPAGVDESLMPEKSIGSSSTSLRLYENLYWQGVLLSAAIETKSNFISSTGSIFSGLGSGGSLFGTSQPLEHWDATFDYITGDSSNLRTRLERLDVTWSMGAYDFDIGRQPLSLGTSHFVGVLDVVAPFAPGDPDATYKPGVDAVRLRRMVGMTGEAEIIGVGSKPWEYGAVLGRFRLLYKGVDFEFVGGRFRQRGFGGVGWEGGISDYGIWGELALFDRKENEEKWRGGWSEAAFSGVAGIDVNLPVDIKAGGALMYQDFGVRNTDDLVDVYDDAPFREGWVFLASAGYGLVTLHRQMHPLVNADIAGLVNLVDSSTLWQPMITISVGDNADMSLYGWIGTGKENTVTITKTEMNSEFGSLPTGGGFYARWFF